jgi:hypothetical protein
VQLAEPGWRSLGDVDRDVDRHGAAPTRRRLWRVLSEEDTTGEGAHFPQLAAGQVAAPARWVESDRPSSPSGRVRPSAG